MSQKTIEILDQISDLSRSLRHGGPHPMDLQELSDALTEATELATQEWHRLQALPTPSGQYPSAIHEACPTLMEIRHLWDLATLEAGSGLDGMQYFANAICHRAAGRAAAQQQARIESLEQNIADRIEGKCVCCRADHPDARHYPGCPVKIAEDAAAQQLEKDAQILNALKMAEPPSEITGPGRKTLWAFAMIAAKSAIQSQAAPAIKEAAPVVAGEPTMLDVLNDLSMILPKDAKVQYGDGSFFSQRAVVEWAVDTIERLQEEQSAPAPVKEAAKGEVSAEPGYGLDAAAIQTLLEASLKPEEIGGDAATQHERVSELVHWFARLARGNANPKWLRGHASELAYFVATNGMNRGINLRAVRDAAYLEGCDVSDADRGTLERLGILKPRNRAQADSGRGDDA